MKYFTICSFMWATILSVDYWRMLTIMSVEYYIAMKYFTILYPWEPQYCLMTTDDNVCWLPYCYELFYDIVPMRATILSSDYWRILTIMSVEYSILLWNILLICTFIYATILSVDYWTYADNNVCWVLYCFEIFYYCLFMWATILFVDYWRMLTIMSVEYYYIAMKYFNYCTHESHNIVWWHYWRICWQYCLLSTIAMKYFIFDSLTTTQQCYNYHSNQQSPS